MMMPIGIMNDANKREDYLSACKEALQRIEKGEITEFEGKSKEDLIRNIASIEENAERPFLE